MRVLLPPGEGGAAKREPDRAKPQEKRRMRAHMPFPLLLRRFLTFGRHSEIQAIRHLRSLGYRIVTSPYRVKGGEVDIIAWDGDVLVFVEVKARRNVEPPEDSVGIRKQ